MGVFKASDRVFWARDDTNDAANDDFANDEGLKDANLIANETKTIWNAS